MFAAVSIKTSFPVPVKFVKPKAESIKNPSASNTLTSFFSLLNMSLKYLSG